MKRSSISLALSDCTARRSCSQAAGWQSIKPPAIESDQFQELVDWLDGAIPEHRSNGRQARVTMEIMMAIYESARTRGLVELPLRTQESPLHLMLQSGALPVEKPGKYDIRL